MLKKKSLLSLLLVFLIVKSLLSTESDNEYLKYYQYDHKLPLNITEKVSKKFSNYHQYRVTFNSVNDEKVYALFNIPIKHEPPYPCIIIQHGYGGNKEYVNLVADLCAKKGYATIAIDAPLHGERRIKGKDIYSTNLKENFKYLTQAIFDLQRTVDYLYTKEFINKEKIGFVGMSMGAVSGSVFCGVDKRVKVVVLVVGGGKWSLMLKESELLAAVRLREHLYKNNIPYEEVDKLAEFIEPLNYVGFISPRPLLMLNGKYDKIVPPESSVLLFDKAKEPKEIVWFDAGHELPFNEAVSVIVEWLTKYW